MAIETERLTLRPWRDEDAAALFGLASDPAVGPAAGWPPHRSVDESREIIRTVFAAPDTFAVCLRETGEPVGCVGLVPPRCDASRLGPGRELEVGYWIGKPFWGRGFAPEAVCAVQRHAFETRGCDALWCGYYEGNERSRRVMEKCGFIPHHVEPESPDASQIGSRTEHFEYLTRDRWRSC